MATNLGRRLLFKVVPNDIEVHRAGDGATRGIRVIGAGLPRTGTLSLRAALRKLLGGNIYHMAEVFDHTEHAEFWVRMIDGTSTWARHSFIQTYLTLLLKKTPPFFKARPVLLRSRSTLRTTVLEWTFRFPTSTRSF